MRTVTLTGPLHGLAVAFAEASAYADVGMALLGCVSSPGAPRNVGDVVRAVARANALVQRADEGEALEGQGMFPARQRIETEPGPVFRAGWGRVEVRLDPVRLTLTVSLATPSPYGEPWAWEHTSAPCRVASALTGAAQAGAPLRVLGETPTEGERHEDTVTGEVTGDRVRFPAPGAGVRR